MMQRTSNDQLICPVCGVANPTTARVCGSCMSALVETAPPPEQPSAITTVAPLDPVVPARQPIQPRPVERTAAAAPRPSRPVNRPAHSLANELRAIAQGTRIQQEEKNGKPWWMSWSIAPLLVAFLGLVGMKGDDVIENLTRDDDDRPQRRGLFG